MILIVALAAFFLLVFAVHIRMMPVLLMADGDEDIKIAGEHFSAPVSGADAADLAAREFLCQKQNGNIDRAHGLGEFFAESLWELAQSIIMDNEWGLTQQEIHHRLLLCSYVANRVIARHLPNPITAQTALSRFYSEVESRSNVLHRHVCDTAAFSLYILNERSDNNDYEIGKIYSKLIGRENDPESVSQGNKVYSSFYTVCKNAVDQVDFSS